MSEGRSDKPDCELEEEAMKTTNRTIAIRVIGTVALWGVMFFALASGVDYFIKFARAILRGPA